MAEGDGLRLGNVQGIVGLGERIGDLSLIEGGRNRK
jgi:hypothetical protein